MTISILLILTSSCPVFAWGGEGHITVGKVASLYAKPQTMQKIRQILKPGETLASISTWADDVKNRVGQHDPDTDTNQFLQDVAHNEKNRDWHFDDLPLKCNSYQTCGDFTTDTDVVSMLVVCIHTLQGQPDPNHPLSQRNALRLLVHLVGDLHQPLHVGSGYINQNGPGHTIVIEKDPQTILNKNLKDNKDRGANLLVFDSHNDNLHSFWDTTLVRDLMAATHKNTPNKLGIFLKNNVTPNPSTWNGQGPPDTWPAQWATDSLHLSNDAAYKSVQITGQHQFQHNTVFDITRANNYESVNTPVVRVQLAKAGYRLAKLLDAIFAP
jgi:hypothetical protein